MPSDRVPRIREKMERWAVEGRSNRTVKLERTEKVFKMKTEFKAALELSVANLPGHSDIVVLFNG